MIVIGADIVPTKSNIIWFEQGKIDNIIDESVQSLLQNADYRIFNLETPLTNVEEPIDKCGPNFCTPTSAVEALKKIRLDLVTLANNHIMDQGVQGLESTIITLANTGISYVGVGKNIKEASQAFFFDINGNKYGVYACAEHEYSIANADYPGANPFDAIESLEHIEAAKRKCDYLIVLYHGGKEYYRYPSPMLQKVCRKMIERGARLVVCQHSHCVGCMENYLHGTIVYGQGNFLFDGQDNEYWNSSILLCINDEGDIEYYPIKKANHKIRRASDEEGQKIIQDFLQRSEEIKSNSILKTKYQHFAEDSLANYIMRFSGKDRHAVFRICNKLSGQRLRKAFVTRYIKRCGLSVRNFIECEAHRELLLYALKNQRKDT